MCNLIAACLESENVCFLQTYRCYLGEISASKVLILNVGMVQWFLIHLNFSLFPQDLEVLACLVVTDGLLIAVRSDAVTTLRFCNFATGSEVCQQVLTGNKLHKMGEFMN